MKKAGITYLNWVGSYGDISGFPQVTFDWHGIERGWTAKSDGSDGFSCELGNAYENDISVLTEAAFNVWVKTQPRQEEGFQTFLDKKGYFEIK